MSRRPVGTARAWIPRKVGTHREELRKWYRRGIDRTAARLAWTGDGGTRHDTRRRHRTDPRRDEGRRRRGRDPAPRGRRVPDRLPGQPDHRGGRRGRHPHRSSSARSAPACTWRTRSAASPPASGSACSPCSTGPGTENAFGGVAQAYGDSVPIVVLPGGYSAALDEHPAELQLARSTIQHVTKWIEQVTVADDVPDAMRRAFTQVQNGRPRPGAGRDPRRRDGARTCRSRSTTSRRPRDALAPDPAAVDEVAAVLVAAERPVI